MNIVGVAVVGVKFGVSEVSLIVIVELVASVCPEEPVSIT